MSQAQKHSYYELTHEVLIRTLDACNIAYKLEDRKLYVREQGEWTEVNDLNLHHPDTLDTWLRCAQTST